MSGLFGTFNIIKRAMGANQYALNTTSHNIANANTEGYSRQRVLLEASKPFGNVSLNSSSGPGQVGTGVDVKEVARIRDSFLDVQIRNQLMKLGTYEAREEFLTNVEVIFMEPSENGISTAMGNMWDAWQEVAANPESSNARTVLVEVSQTLADQIRSTYNQLKGLQEDAGRLIEKSVDEVNSFLTQINDLNSQIKAVKLSGNNPNDLMDRRDLLIDEMSKMLDIEVIQVAGMEGKDTGAIEITLDGHTLLGEGGVGSLSYSSDGGLKIKGVGEENWTDINYKDNQGNIKGGKIHGYTSVSIEIGEYIDKLNAMTKAMARAINLVHKDGNKDYENFFTAEVENPMSNGKDITAENIRVNPKIYSNPLSINTEADIEKAASNPNYNNGDRALAIAMLRDVKLDINNLDNIMYDKENMTIKGVQEGTTIDDFFEDIIGKLGTSTREASNMVTNQDALVNQLLTRKDSISGVSMDEEMTNLIQFQRSYTAAARMVTVIDELLQSIINMVR